MDLPPPTPPSMPVANLFGLVQDSPRNVQMSGGNEQHPGAWRLDPTDNFIECTVLLPLEPVKNSGKKQLVPEPTRCVPNYEL